MKDPLERFILLGFTLLICLGLLLGGVEWKIALLSAFLSAFGVWSVLLALFSLFMNPAARPFLKEYGRAGTRLFHFLVGLLFIATGVMLVWIFGWNRPLF